MNGLDLFRSPKTAADEIADIVSAQCPPVVPENCDAFSCRECWLAWLTIMTASGLTLEGESVLVIEGHSSITGKPAKVKLTEFGFEFFGDDVTEEEVARVRNARCCYIGTVDTSKES